MRSKREFHMRFDASARLPLAVVPLPAGARALSRSSLLLMFSHAFRQSFHWRRLDFLLLLAR
jgi:hypothetical protein